jgi:hypothetical protein
VPRRGTRRRKKVVGRESKVVLLRFASWEV